MTESDWATCTHPAAMLSFLRDRGASERKLRLFAVACARRAWPLIDDLGRAAVELAERFADGRADAEQLRAARLACKGSGGQSSWYAAVTNPAIAARNAALSVLDGATRPDRERLAQADLLRDIFNNPIRPVSLDSSRRTEMAVALAARMYETRDFSLMPVMGDALHDAGCENNDILEHCRGSGPHVRGCYVVDLVLSLS
jgi:hypothetical protein